MVKDAMSSKGDLYMKPSRCLASTGFGGFSGLSPEVVSMIAQYLSYRDVSLPLSRIINPQLAPEESKIAIVMHAEKDIERHHNKDNERLGCYVCHRVIEIRKFAIPQLSTDPYSKQNLRRFCINCGILKGTIKQWMYYVCATERLGRFVDANEL